MMQLSSFTTSGFAAFSFRKTETGHISTQILPASPTHLAWLTFNLTMLSAFWWTRFSELLNLSSSGREIS